MAKPGRGGDLAVDVDPWVDSGPVETPGWLGELNENALGDVALARARCISILPIFGVLPRPRSEDGELDRRRFTKGRDAERDAVGI